MVEDHPDPARRVIVGLIRRPVGLRGEVVVEPTGEDPDRFAPHARLWTEGDPLRELRIRASRRYKAGVAIFFEGIETVEAAQNLRGVYLSIRVEELPPLPAGTYYHYQLLGLEVVDALGRVLGRLESILQTGSNDVYCVGKGKDEILIPAIREYVERIDLPGGRIFLAVERNRLGGDEPPV